MDKNSNVQYLNAQVLFESNTAEYTGGAIQINDMDAENPCCPFNHINLSPESPDSGLIFKNNAARFGGDDIYGGQLDQAFVYHENNVTRCIQILQQTITFLLSRTLSSISSKPSRVCLCNSNYNPDCLQVFDSRDAYPGEDITVSVFAVGQSFGTSAGYVNAQLLLSDTFSLNPTLGYQQQYQVVEQYTCNFLTYTISSHPQLVILVLTTETELIQNYGSEADVNQSIQEYNMNHRSYVPKSLLDFPVYINVTLKHCPSAFNLTGVLPKCACFPRLLEIDGVKCRISKREVERSGTVWIGNSTNHSSAAVLFSKYCPYNYCNPATVNIFNYFAAQCQWGHSGRLCGECPKGMSLTLGASKCRQCSNNHLGLLAVFAVGGVALVTFLKVTDLTTAGGLINGLILYSNLVKAGSYLYFPYSTYLQPFQLFIDWLNLDFGIEVCFFNGLDGYWKTWLQFVFPVCVSSLSVGHITDNDSLG